MKKITLLCLLCMALFSSMMYATDYTNGYFVGNEDWFGHAPGSVNYVDASGTIHYNVFQSENPGKSLGVTTCFSSIFSGNMYFISKQSFNGVDEHGTSLTGSRLVVANANTLKEIASIDNLGADGRAFTGFTPYKGYVSTADGVKPLYLMTNTLGDFISNLSGECGTMYTSHNKLFIQKSSEVVVIDAQKDTLMQSIAVANLACLQQTPNGTLWAGTTDNKLVKINPADLSTTVINAPTEFLSSSFAWNPGLMATGDSTIYFATGSSWSPRAIKKYDVKTNTFHDFYTVADTLVLYGGGFRINPKNQHMIALVKKEGWGDKSEHNWYLELDENGNEVSMTKLVLDYWFPTMPFFPENTLNTSVATFEDFKLGNESFWWGDFTTDASVNTNFTSGDYTFTNIMSYWAPNAYASNFGVSNETTTVNTPFKGSNSAAGKGALGSENYGVFYVPFNVKSQITLATQAPVTGLYVTNNTNVISAINNGDGMSTETNGEVGLPFATGDYLKLIAHGFLNGTETNTVEFYLADYRSTQSDQHYALTTWEWMDLKALGNVDTVTFSFVSSKNNAYGMTTPGYFCLDNVGDTRPESLSNAQTFENSLDLDLSTITTTENHIFDGHFTLIELEDPSIATVSIINDHLQVSALQTGNTNVVVMATQKSGKRIYIRIPLDITLNTSLVETSMNTQVSYFNQTIQIETEITDYSIHIFNTNGVLVYSNRQASGNTSIASQGFTNGIYFVRITNSEMKETYKVVL